MGRHGFSAAEAAAWLRLSAPPAAAAPPPPLAYLLELEREAAEAAAAAARALQPLQAEQAVACLARHDDNFAGLRAALSRALFRLWVREDSRVAGPAARRTRCRRRPESDYGVLADAPGSELEALRGQPSPCSGGAQPNT